MAASNSNNSKHQIFGTVLLLFFLAPLWMYLVWLFIPKRQLVVAIVDKTVLTQKGQEHVSLNWILRQEKFSKTKSALYDQSKDYYGFFPLDNKKYTLKGLERFSHQQLDQLSNDADLVYFTDAYGIFKNEWYGKGDDKARSGIVYGGMSEEDIDFLSLMRDKNKLIITEFNCLASPTAPVVRTKFENLFGIKWTGWIGRYFESLDSNKNSELPQWLMDNYKKQHQGLWPFSKSGIVFVHSDNRIVVLENGKDLAEKYPEIQSNTEGQNHYHLPPKIPYTFWFDIIEPDLNFNHVIADFNIPVTDKGSSILEKNGIPTVFPAITIHKRIDYQFFYFSADFSDNPIETNTAYFKGLPYLKMFLYYDRDPMSRKAFFWKLYQPMVTTILNDYYALKNNTKTD